MVFDYSKFHEFRFNTLQSRKVGVGNVGLEKYTSKFLTPWIKHLTSQEVGGGGGGGGRGKVCRLHIGHGVMVAVFCKKVIVVERNITFYKGNDRACLKTAFVIHSKYFPVSD